MNNYINDNNDNIYLGFDSYKTTREQLSIVKDSGKILNIIANNQITFISTPSGGGKTTRIIIRITPVIIKI